MSAVEAGKVGTVPRRAVVAGRVPGAAWLRLFRSELRLVFGRRRNQAGMAVLAVVPILIAFAVWRTTGRDGSGDGPPFLAQIAGNGLFVALTALTAELPLFLPLAIAAIAGDTVAGEANSGTLRYLLTVPVSRTRVLTVKFAAVVVFTLASVALVLSVGVIVGLLLFGGGPATLLSGTEVPFLDALGRLALVGLYAAACLLALGAIGLFVSTLTEQPIGATIAVMVLAVTSQILDAVPQLSAIHRYLPTHYWLGFGDLLRDPIAFDAIRPGLLSTGVYIVLFSSAAWARLGSKDVTS